jgi:hypothetical protein
MFRCRRMTTSPYRYIVIERIAFPPRQTIWLSRQGGTRCVCGKRSFFTYRSGFCSNFQGGFRGCRTLGSIRRLAWLSPDWPTVAVRGKLGDAWGNPRSLSDGNRRNSGPGKMIDSQGTRWFCACVRSPAWRLFSIVEVAPVGMWARCFELVPGCPDDRT